MSKNNNYSPISVIDSEQMMISGYHEHTALAYKIYKNLIHTSYEYKYYAGKKYTFVKWYIDNIFTKDLFKYTDISFMKEQISLAIDEDIDIKLKEIERLKQMKANLILQQQIKGTSQRNIEENSKEQAVKTAHK